MSMQLVPYSHASIATITDYSPTQGPAFPGHIQGVYITLVSADYQFILNKIIGWFADRDEVELIDHGISDKQQDGYIILEWIETTVDQLFLAILRDEETVADYTVYTRSFERE